MTELTNVNVTKLTKQVAQEWANRNRSKIKPYAYNNTLKLLKAIWNNALETDITNLPNPFTHTLKITCTN